LLILGGLERDAADRACDCAKVACHASFLTIRVAGEDDPSAPPGRNVGLLLRILDRDPFAEHGYENGPDCFYEAEHKNPFDRITGLTGY